MILEAKIETVGVGGEQEGARSEEAKDVEAVVEGGGYDWCAERYGF